MTNNQIIYNAVRSAVTSAQLSALVRTICPAATLTARRATVF